MKTKVCSKCKISKPLEEFYPRPTGKDGYSYKCRSCKSVLSREYRENNKLKIKTRYDKWRTDNREKMLKLQREGQQKYNRKYPEKIKAHAIANAHKDKLLGKECELCGSKGSLEMHHQDYSKPLEVITLCPLCHTDVHRKVFVDAENR